jgi:hypothetical protein
LAITKSIPRGRYIGRRVGGEPKDFIKCPVCGGWIDMRDAKYWRTKDRYHIRQRIGRNECAAAMVLSMEGIACRPR